MGMDKKIIFVHGYTASSDADWYPALRPELDKLGVDYTVPDLPGGRYPKSAEWLKIIQQEFNKTDKPVVLVGHSLGTRAVLLFLDQFNVEADTVILIAPFSNEPENAHRRNGQAYPDFFEYKIDISKIKQQVKKFVIIHSEDDYSLNYHSQGESLAVELGIEITKFEDRGHFTLPEDAPYILEVLRKELGF